MGCHPNITPDHFPRQGAFLGKTVEVCFDYDTSATMRGRVLRDDAEEPGRMIILLENGWAVLSTECQYSFSQNLTERMGDFSPLRPASNSQLVANF